jgi:excisionase family DNA binding protein
MLSTVRQEEPLAATAAERRTLTEIEQMLAADQARAALLTDANPQAVELPDVVVRALRQIVQHLARDQAVTIVAVDRDLTTQQAADLLNVSRPYLITLLERGDLPYTRTGTHRRIRLDDLLAYRERRDVTRRRALDEITRLSDDLGLYE